ncbi:Intersectin-1 [Trichinella nativa]|uniref:Intersectin-1 n=2 Tax=Trichinella nativa TaxID=6335 RepID=A0A0V1KZV9_9BILA|nr:Intersectin-1 [Trichinella nativa]
MWRKDILHRAPPFSPRTRFQILDTPTVSVEVEDKRIVEAIHSIYRHTIDVEPEKLIKERFQLKWRTIEKAAKGKEKTDISKIKEKYFRLFVTVGSTEFDNLIAAVTSDSVLSALKSIGVGEIRLQIGRGRHESVSNLQITEPSIVFYRYKNSLAEDLKWADLVISHAGAASCLEALELEKPLLVVVNDSLLDNHQIELADRLSKDGVLHYCTVGSLADTVRLFPSLNRKRWKAGDPEIFVTCDMVADNWELTPEQCFRYSQQFLSLRPINGMLTGDQAKTFFTQFRLPSSMLAEIWNLSDISQDGMLDQVEFALAMFLVEKRMHGANMPKFLPSSMINQASRLCGVPQRRASAAQAGLGALIGTVRPPTGINLSTPDRSKYGHLFHGMDQTKSGYLTGKDARLILSRSGLSNDVLARIWFLSDLDKDGRLNLDEFCLAMGYIDAAKAGITLPAVADVVRDPRKRNKSMGTESVESIEFGASVESGDENRLRSAAKSFEDKRRENFERGQVELDRRRQQLLKVERQEREERERKERDEQARKERERQEAERRRQVEMEQRLQKQREEQLRLDQEHRKLVEQREAARRELERQRQLEWDKMRLEELTVQRQRELEAVCHGKRQRKNLAFQVQALGEKAVELNGKIGQLRQKVYDLTSTFDRMKQARDDKLRDIDCQRRSNDELNAKLHHLATKRQALLAKKQQFDLDRTTTLNDATSNELDQSLANRMQIIEGLRKNVDDNVLELRSKKSRCSVLEKQLEELGRLAQHEWRANEELIRRFDALRRQAELNENPTTATALYNDEPVLVAEGNEPAPVTVKYRALYEFVARTDDELSFQPGDVIFVFKNHACEPGWLAGQIKDKVGWFPEEFAECIEPIVEEDRIRYRHQQDANAENVVGEGVVEEEQAALNQEIAPPPHQQQQATTIQKLESINEESFDKDDSNPATATATTGGDGDAGSPGLYATALYNLHGKSENHLSFNKGDIIRIVEQQEMWWKGELEDGREGWFPKSYVKIGEPSSSSSQHTLKRGSLTFDFTTTDDISRESKKRNDFVKNKALSVDVVTMPSSNRMDRAANDGGGGGQATDWWKTSNKHGGDDDIANGQQQGDQKQTVVSGEWYVATYSFVASEAGDLPFNVGDHILVTRKDSEWWTGIAGNMEGIFPANYVKPLDDTSSSFEVNGTATATTTAASDKQQDTVNDKFNIFVKGRTYLSFILILSVQKLPSVVLIEEPIYCELGQAIAPFQATDVNQLTLNLGDLVKIRTKSPTGWWEGELQAGGEKRIGWFPGVYVKIVDLQQPANNDYQVGKIESTQLVRAQYDYTRQQDVELTFKQGDMIKVLEKPDGDWWLGQCMSSGQMGLFPATYVVPSEEANAEDIRVRVHNGNDDDDDDGGGALKRSVSDADGRLSWTKRTADVSQTITNSSSWTETDRRRRCQLQELIQSERNYVDDLLMVRDVFQKPLSRQGLLSAQEVDRIFVSWSRLVKVSTRMLAKLQAADGDVEVGKVLLELLPFFEVFVCYGRQLRAALDFLDYKLKTNKLFEAVHIRCCADSRARGLPLNYYLLLPMTRFTKYPLMLQQLLKQTSPAQADYDHLEQAVSALKQLCVKVNRLASEAENVHMLHWCQNHVRCDNTVPKLVFNGLTNRLGPRQFLHAGPLQKAKSGRLLVAFLFNDMLLLSTPDEPIIDPMAFKLSQNSELTFTLYKQPILLADISLQMSQDCNQHDHSNLNSNFGSADGCAFSILFNSDQRSIQLKALSSNSRLLWKKQLDAAIAKAKESNEPMLLKQQQQQQLNSRTLSLKHPIGRLNVDIQSVRNLPIPIDTRNCPVTVELSVADSKQLFIVDMNRKDVLCSGQFGFESLDSVLRVRFVVELQLAPNICVGRTEISIADMLKLAGPSRTPAVKALPLVSDFVTDNNPSLSSVCVVIKFLVHLFNDI